MQKKMLHQSAILILLRLSLALSDCHPPTPSTNTPPRKSFSEAATIARPHCRTRCGNLTVPYPFGIGLNSSCSIDPSFEVNCDTSYTPPKLFISEGDREIVDISEQHVRIRNWVATACYNESGYFTSLDNVSFDFKTKAFPYSFSDANQFMVVGCDDWVDIVGPLGIDRSFVRNYTSSCASFCSNISDPIDGFCMGNGCCRTSVPKGLLAFSSKFYTLDYHMKVHSFNPCGYAFIGEAEKFEFHASYLWDMGFKNWMIENVPIVLDWAIGNLTCNQAKKNGDFACRENSDCVDSDSTGLGGYRCNCSEGYEGNPYLSPGCTDIDECQNNPCHEHGICNNTLGGYNCSCAKGYKGDGRKDGFGCVAMIMNSQFPVIKFSIGLLAGFGLFLIMAISFWSYKILKKRRSNKLKQAFFKRNGGLLLQQQVSAHDSILDRMKVFTSKELERATNKFNESRILGRGGQGTVYKGMLTDGRIVAVKKSKRVNETQLVEFINELAILSQINHRNVVKLLGCCLETEVPLLVYEFIPNGTLYELIHDDTNGFLFSWDLRLRIAAEIANALAYLHYATSIPIYHRDMKSNNILLDEKYRAKLSDFGISRLVAIDQTHLTTEVKGTFGYLDPEYFHTWKFTEKSDVYSFGVVLVELLTGEKPISNSVTEEEDEERSLIMRFLMTMKENSLKTILDPRLAEQDVKEEHLAVANLAKRCLNLNGRKRPTIREVAMALESIRTSDNPLFVESKMQDLSYFETGTVESKMRDLSYSETDSFVLNRVERASSSWILNNY